jgi:IS5 family transposase
MAWLTSCPLQGLDEEALYEIASLRNFAGLKLGEPIPDETTILNFRHILEEYGLAEDVRKQANAHLTRKGLLLKRGQHRRCDDLAAPSSTKNAEGKRIPRCTGRRTVNSGTSG